MTVQEHIAYFDNAATSFPKPESVYLAMDDCARNYGVSMGRGQHILSARASHIADETRDLLLQLFHCSNKKVVFTNTATEAMNIILTPQLLPSGCAVYISPFEHNAVTRVLHHLKNTQNITIHQLAVNSNALQYDLDKIKKQFSEAAPHCVIISHASNVTGAIAPMREIFSIAKKYDAITIADMCQTAGLIDMDISSTDFDYVVFAGHKTLYGPLGVSGFISQYPERLCPLIYGGTGVESANQDMPTSAPERFEAGSHSSIAIAGLNASIRWLLETGIHAVFDREQKNKARLIEVLEQYDNIRIIKASEQIGLISCLFDKYSSDEIGQVLSEQKIAFRSGLHCAPYAHQFIKTFPAGTVRFSVGYFNTDEDFSMLDHALQYIYENS